jgi:hypothetical protein
MGDAQVREYLRLRLIVGYLGERENFNWWSTEFFSGSSRQFLEPAFPKTYPLAQYHGVSEAARRLHDDHIGKGQVLHLFRLPEELEHNLHNLMLQELPADDLLEVLKDKTTALQSLAELAASSVTKAEGPVSVGKRIDANQRTTIQKIAQIYLGAFKAGVRSYPYLAG